MTNSKTPLFVTGTQRSGTTLVHHILNQSSQIYSQNEIWDLHDGIFGNTSRDLEIVRHELVRTYGEPFVSEHESETTNPIELTERILGAKARLAGKPRWCLKDPRITYFLPEFASAFPESKFVILLRDPRAVCHSYLHSPGFRVGRPANAFAGANRWKKEVELHVEFANSFPDRCRLIRYEDIVIDFRKTLDSLCEFLSIPCESNMVSYYRQGKTTQVHEGNQNILTAPDRSHAEKWRGSLSPNEVSQIEFVARDSMTDFNYVAEQSNVVISPIKQCFLTQHDRWVAMYRWKRFQATRLIQKFRSPTNGSY